VKPGFLMTYHRSTFGEELSNSNGCDVLVDEKRQCYRGLVIAAKDSRRFLIVAPARLPWIKTRKSQSEHITSAFPS